MPLLIVWVFVLDVTHECLHLHVPPLEMTAREAKYSWRWLSPIRNGLNILLRYVAYGLIADTVMN
jgi:hypothetical protein